MPNFDYTIRELRSIGEFAEAFELQKVVWRLSDYGDCVPDHVLKAVSESGGLVLGAYAGNVPAGFLMAMVARDRSGAVYHHSHILGVHPDYSEKNIGFRLKTGHMKRAVSEGIRLVTWTYDPLLGANARLNIGKLGGIVREYRVDYYGEVMGDSALVSGLPSDRFWVEWYIQSDRVQNRVDGRESGTAPYPVESGSVIRLDETAAPVGWDHNRIGIEIPADFQALYDADREKAKDIRLRTRETFLESFRNGYTVTDFIRGEIAGEKANYYVLKKQTEMET